MSDWKQWHNLGHAPMRNQKRNTGYVFLEKQSDNDDKATKVDDKGVYGKHG
jgi:hypothetical protein